MKKKLNRKFGLFAIFFGLIAALIFLIEKNKIIDFGKNFVGPDLLTGLLSFFLFYLYFAPMVFTKIVNVIFAPNEYLSKKIMERFSFMLIEEDLDGRIRKFGNERSR